MSRRSSSRGSRLLKSEGTWSETLTRALAELIGSAILVYIGCMGCVGTLAEPAPRLQIALTFGFAIASIVQIIGPISHCHINPLVSICSVILGLRTLTSAGSYIVAQFLGAIIGYGLLMVVTPLELLHTGNPATLNSFCVSAVNEKISPIQGLLVETSAAGILVMFVCACMDPRNKHNADSKAIKFGLLISMLVMACGPYTGCSMNPARSFAPALWNGVWTFHWVYWLGPISGAVLSSLIYRILFWPKQSQQEQIPEAAPLTTIITEKSELK